MEHGQPLVSSRAALAEMERQRIRMAAPGRAGPRVPMGAADGGGGPGRRKGDEEAGSSKGHGRKDDVQKKPDDQKGDANPKEGEGRKAP